MANSSMEGYLKVILSLSGRRDSVRNSDIARGLGIAPASVTEMLEKLAKKKLICHLPYQGVALTRKGRAAAETVLRRYQLLERFFVEYLKVRPAEAARQACLMEHCISKETERRVCQIMKHPELSIGNERMPKCRLAENCNQCTREFPLRQKPEPTR